MHRRTFLEGSAIAAGLAFPSGIPARARAQGKPGAKDRIAVAVAGVRGRGGSLLAMFA
ncbi:MAG: hypothetical protein ACUVUC_05445 [Thermoguttaceae bacterium]